MIPIENNEEGEPFKGQKMPPQTPVQEQYFSDYLKKPVNTISFDPSQKKRSPKWLGGLIVGITTLAILALMGAFYYYATRAYVSDETIEYSGVKKDTKAQGTESQKTKVLSFVVPEKLPALKKAGSCWMNSLAQPYRADAWRCAIGSDIYDPCFKIKDANSVLCQNNPLKDGAFVMSLSKPLPTVQMVPQKQDNWAWFLTLRDAEKSPCAPFTGDQAKVNGEDGLYSCTTATKNQQIVLVGELTRGPIWTARKALLERTGIEWKVLSEETVEVDTVWQ